jgi:heterodisulfide reductase subunit A-like polyferredoxin
MLTAPERCESVKAQPENSMGAPKPVPEKRALVIGGGIAGIQAALDLADARIRVTLVEQSPSLGGRMAQLDKTFPTMDCSI